MEKIRRIHAGGAKWFNGTRMRYCAKDIAALVEKHGSKSLLDYGSGRGAQYQEPHMLQDRWGGIMPTLYDPGVEGLWDKPKGRFDGVFCIHVMEYVAPENTPDIVAEILKYARQWAYFRIGTGAASKKAVVRTNIHEEEWWLRLVEKLKPAGLDVVMTFAGTEQVGKKARKIKNRK